MGLELTVEHFLNFIIRSVELSGRSQFTDIDLHIAERFSSSSVLSLQTVTTGTSTCKTLYKMCM